MVRAKELSVAIRAQTMLLHGMGISERKIGTQLNISRGAVQKCIGRAKENPATQFLSRKRSGRPKVTSGRTDNMIMLMAKRSPRASSLKIKSQLPATERVSASTIRRRLFAGGLKSRRPAKKPLLTAKNVRDRIAFCRKYRNWTADEWENVLFSDESTFSQFYAFSRHVRRPVGKRHDPKYCISSVTQYAKLMVWGSFSGKGGRAGIWFMKNGETINAKVYQGILTQKLQQFRQIHDVEYFQHDGAPSHTAKSVQKWLADNHIPVIGPWPGSSPDLNPIENLWIQIKRKVAAHSPTSAEHLQEVVKSVWIKETSLESCKNLARSMPSRILGVLKAKGKHTKY